MIKLKDRTPIPEKQFMRWLQALYNQEFKQGYGRLEDAQDGFCCLGVACKLFIPKGLQRTHKGEHRLWGALPTEQPSPEWLKRINDDFKDRTGINLSSLNDYGLIEPESIDGNNFTHPEIASMLELVYIHKILDDEAAAA